MAGFRPRRWVAVAGLVPVVVGAGLVAGGGIGYVDHQVDATIADPATSALPGPMGRVLWQANGSDVQLGPIALAGGRVVTGVEASGEVTVTDAASGKPLWHYTRHDAEASSVTASSNERAVVVVYTTETGNTVL